MTDLDALLAGIVAHPHEAVRWLIVADWLDDHGQPERAELLRLHRMLIDTCCEPDRHPERAAWQARIVELIDRGVTPCVPQHTLMLPGGVPLVGNFIPPGSFLMGSEEFDSERPDKRVTITKGFFVGVYLVTQAQWSAVMENNPSQFKGQNRPVEMVGWNDCTAFCEKVSKLSGHVVRLPREAEWEYVCRAGTHTHFHYGDVPSIARMWYDALTSWNGSDTWRYRPKEFEQTKEVGSFAPNPWGLFDCHGNVYEWCEDFYIPRRVFGSPDGYGFPWAICRGGSWHEFPEECCASYRNATQLDDRFPGYGFRIVFTLD